MLLLKAACTMGITSPKIVFLESMSIRQTGATIFRIFDTVDCRYYVLLNPIQSDVAR